MFTTITEHDLQCIIENNSLPFITGIHICMYLAYTFFIEKILDVDELSINTQTFCSWQFSFNKHLISFYRNLSQTLTCWNGMLVHHHHLTNRTLLHEICPGEEKTNIPCWCLHQIRTREPHFSSCPSLFWMKTRLSPLNLRQKKINIAIKEKLFLHLFSNLSLHWFINPFSNNSFSEGHNHQCNTLDTQCRPTKITNCTILVVILKLAWN